MEVAGTWNGKIYGTNTGNISIKLKQNEKLLEGEVRLMDDTYGVVVYNAKGSVDDSVHLLLEPIQFVEDVQVSKVQVNAVLNGQGHLQGEWSSDLGTGGTFLAFPHGSMIKSAKKSDTPEQIYNKTIFFGSVRLYGNDLKKLIQIIKKDFVQGRVVITYDFNGHKITKYAEDFFNEISDIKILRAITINIQEPEFNGINRSVVIEFAEYFGSVIRVSSSSETWVVGKAETLKKALTDYERFIVTNYRRYGLDINFLIFLTMLVAMPEIQNWPERLSFVLCILVLLLFLLRLHRKFIPNTLITNEKKNISLFKRNWPTILSLLMTIVSALISGILLTFFTGGEVFGVTGASMSESFKNFFDNFQNDWLSPES